MGDVTNRAERLGQQAQGSDWLDHAIRLGLVAYGVVHLLIAWLAIQLALGDNSGKASSTGAMHQLAQQPLGGVLVWVIAIGMFLLVLWRLLEAALGHRDEDGGKRLRKRLGSAGKAVLYGAIAVSALRVATSSGGSSGQKSSSDSTTAKLMDLPAGQWIVAGVGLAIIAYGANLVRRAWTEKFAEHLDAEGKSGDTGRAYLLFGKVGYVAKGVAIGIVGSLFVYAGVSHESKKSGGLDQALHKVLQQPFGPVLLFAIGIGIGCYGLFCFARARHLAR
ncbi:DUF1206 domain-containing protein [Nocardioides sp.]|uniref:DUF1206 domain-containing protein n=1 Tax=Nocardioides sp. TaxID=35761 RepID=UPI0031FF0EAE|nr:hypothetical protein [Nocardioides sp.]